MRVRSAGMAFISSAILFLNSSRYLGRGYFIFLKVAPEKNSHRNQWPKKISRNIAIEHWAVWARSSILLKPRVYEFNILLNRLNRRRGFVKCLRKTLRRYDETPVFKTRLRYVASVLDGPRHLATKMEIHLANSDHSFFLALQYLPHHPSQILKTVSLHWVYTLILRFKRYFPERIYVVIDEWRDECTYVTNKM